MGVSTDAPGEWGRGFRRRCIGYASVVLLRRVHEPAIVPAHWPHRGYEWLRRGRAPWPDRPGRVIRFARDLGALPILIEPPHAPAAWDAVIRVATECGLSVYDAAYLELAERTRLPLASLDSDLRKAALAAGVVLLDT